MLSGNSLLLLEEPELSLNDAIVRQIPLMLQRLQRDSKHRRQIIISTHSEALLSNPGIDGRGIIVLKAGPEGSTARPVTVSEADALKAGFSPAEVILPNVAQKTAEKLSAW